MHVWMDEWMDGWMDGFYEWIVDGYFFHRPVITAGGKLTFKRCLCLFSCPKV